jgi:hypothetical protein
MSQSGGGLSSSEVESIARGVARQEAQLVEQRIEKKINSLMDDIRAIGNQLQSAIQIQTAAIIAGVGATTSAVISTRSEISETRNQLSEILNLQLRSELQLELGRKLNVARSASAKLKQFFQDVRSRFEKSVEGIFFNRIEYGERFNEIFDAYEHKVRTIGKHIFEIRDEIRLLESSCSQSHETIYSLPMEVDLYRLGFRSKELDQTVDMLESSRLQEIRSSLDELNSVVSKLSFQQGFPSDQQPGLEALLVVSSSGDQDLLLAAKAMRSPSESVRVDNNVINDDESQLSNELAHAVVATLTRRKQRPFQEEEYIELIEAIRTLSEDGIISPDDVAFASAIVESRKVSIYV